MHTLHYDSPVANTNHDPPAYLTTDEIADLLRVSRGTVRRWVHDGDLPRVNLGVAGFRFRRADVDAFIAKRMETGPSPDAP